MQKMFGLLCYLFCYYYHYAFALNQIAAVNNKQIKLTDSSSTVRVQESAVAILQKLQTPSMDKAENITVKRKYNHNNSWYKRRYKYQAAARAASIEDQLNNMTLDFTYSGDVSGIIYAIKEYNPNISILAPIGKKKEVNINISLQGARLPDITHAVASQTNNTVSLIYSTSNNSLRLNYTGAIDVGQNAVEESLKWQKGGNPKPVLKQDGVVRFPYGEYQPVVICQPLNLCDIELQAGEDIQGIVIGDSLRWNEGDQGIPIVYSGNGAKLVPHLVLKPSQSGLDTTLMVTTSKRTYMLKLKSALNGHVARVGFYYPGEVVQTFINNKTKLKEKELQIEQSTNISNNVLQMPLINLSRVNYAYVIKGDDYIWKPTQVFDDGVSVYIQMPDGVNARSLPGLCILADGDSSEGRCEMVNFRYNDHFYIVDKLFNKAKLINGYDNNMQSIMISRKPEKPGLWSRIFGG